MNSKIKLIAEAFARLDVLNNQRMTSYRERLLAECVGEEKEHRGHDFSRFHTSDSVSVHTAAKLFVVHRIAQYLKGDKLPKVRDYLHIQRSCFFAAALVVEYRKEIRRAWKGLSIAELAALDYCEFVKVRPSAAA